MGKFPWNNQPQISEESDRIYVIAAGGFLSWGRLTETLTNAGRESELIN